MGNNNEKTVMVSNEKEKAGRKEKSSKNKKKLSKHERDLDLKALESIRRKAMQEIMSDENLKRKEGRRKILDAGWRLIWSYGFTGNDLGKAWRELKGNGLGSIGRW
jgi:hypothetical protein